MTQLAQRIAPYEDRWRTIVIPAPRIWHPGGRVVEEEGILKHLAEGTMVMRSPHRTRRSRDMATAFGAMRYAYCALRATLHEMNGPPDHSLQATDLANPT